MAVKVPEPTLVAAGQSHWITENYKHELEKEEVFFTFHATWRGQPVEVEMRADRYRHSSGLSEWRIHANRAGYIPEENPDRWGPDVTDTARARLADACRPLVERWLDSGDYKVSEHNAVLHLIRRQLQDDVKFPGMENPTRRTRAAVEAWAAADKLTPRDVDHYTHLCDLYDAFSAAYRGVELCVVCGRPITDDDDGADVDELGPLHDRCRGDDSTTGE